MGVSARAGACAATAVVAVCVAGGTAAQAQTFRVRVEATVSGSYKNHVEFDPNKCGAESDVYSSIPNPAMFDEDATFSFDYAARPLTFTLRANSRAHAAGRQTRASGGWHQHGTWYPGNRCSDPSHTDDCTGPIAANGRGRYRGANARVDVTARSVGFFSSSGARYLGEPLSSEGNCPSVAGSNAKPIFGLHGALQPWETVYTFVSVAKLRRTRPGRTLTLRARNTLQSNGWDPATCNGVGLCAGHLTTHATIRITMLR